MSSQLYIIEKWGNKLNKKENILKLLSIVIGLGVIIASVLGLFYSTGGERFTVLNVYGDKVQMYGDGIYAFNSVLSVANRMGADAAGIITSIVLIVFTLWNRRTLVVEIVKTSAVILVAYHCSFLVFGISMNSLYLLYVLCFGLSLFVAFTNVRSLLASIEVPESLRKKRITGTGVFLIAVGVTTALLWGSTIIPSILNNTYGNLLGIQTTEATYGIDLSITCPVFIMCGIWVLRKRDIGYKAAPLLLNVMVGIAILVISQRIYCAKLGIDIPLGALIGFIISFVIMGLISLYLVTRLLKRLRMENIVAY